MPPQETGDAGRLARMWEQAVRIWRDLADELEAAAVDRDAASATRQQAAVERAEQKLAEPPPGTVAS